MKITRIGTAQRRSRIGLRHLLAPSIRVTDPVKAAEAMIGLHGTDPTSFFLAARARVKELTIADMERSLYEERALLRILGMRRTLFVAPITVAGVIQVSSADDIAIVERRRLLTWIDQAGIASDSSAWLNAVCRKTVTTLGKTGPVLVGELTKLVPELAERIHVGAGSKWAVSQPIASRVIFLLSAEGKVARGRPRGSWVSGQHRWVAMDQWLEGGLPTPATDSAREELVRRWLTAFGPGTIADLKWWTGWTMGQVRKTLASIDPIEVDMDGAPGIALPGDLEPESPPKPWVAMLPALDATPMGWSHRDWYLGAHKPQLFDRNGNVGPTIWCNGRIVGGWAQTASRSVAYRLLEDVGAQAVAAIEMEAAEVEKFTAGSRVTPRFRTPLEKQLAQ